MRKLALLLFGCLWSVFIFAQTSAVNPVRIMSSNDSEIILKIRLDDVRQAVVHTPQGAAIQPLIKDGVPHLVEGEPNLPKWVRLLQLPDNGHFEVAVIESSFEDYRNILMVPSKGNLLRTVDPETVPYTFGKAYTTDRFLPGTLATLQDAFVQRSVRGQALWINPIQYNPAQKTMRVYHQFTLRITTKPGILADHPALTSQPNAGRTFEDIYEKLYLNYTPEAARSGRDFSEKMLVIAPEAYTDGLAPLLSWKRQTGIHTTLKTIEEIGANDAVAIRTFIQEYYETDEITFVLIVGDENQVISEMRPSGGGMYSCDNCFGYMNDDDHIQDVLVGRLHASNPEQLAVMVNRILEYEKSPLLDPAKNWFGTGMASASNEGQGFGDDGQADYEHANEWKIKHLENGFETYWEFYDGDHSAISPTPGHPSADQPGDPSNGPLVALMNEPGVSIYNYTGHGWEQGLSSGNFNVDAVGELRNTGRYPIVIGVACCAGNFTNGECLGEALQRAGDIDTGIPYGGIAGFFSSDFQSWSPPMEGQDGMNGYLVDADGVDLFPTIGGMAAYGNALMIAAYGDNGELMADFWNPFTEPSIVPRMAYPVDLEATHTASLFIGDALIEVSSPVEGAKVGLYWNDQTLAVGTIENGVATLAFEPLDGVGDLIITLTQFNHLPYQDTLQVAPLSGPYVIRDGYAIDDSAGNGNDQADFGEVIDLDLTLSNVGLEDASDIVITLESNTTGITLIKDSENLDLLEIGATLTLMGAARFQVADDIEDGTKAVFRVLLSFNGNQNTESVIEIPLNAPSFEIGATVDLEDPSPDGNANRRMEEGERISLLFNTTNKGGADSPEATVTLSADSPFLTIEETEQIIDGILSTEQRDIPFRLNINGDVPYYQAVNFTLSIQAGAYEDTQVFGPYWINPIVEDFETDNFETFPWETPEEYPWITSTTNPYFGEHCAQSDTIEDNQQSDLVITLNVVEAGFVGFSRRVSSEQDWDYLRFYIDDEEQAAWSGELGWESFTFPIDTGVHILRWSYIKDEIISAGDDLAWVDEIYLPVSEEIISSTFQPEKWLDVAVSPNPGPGLFQVTWSQDAPSQCTIDLISLSGQIIQTSAIQGQAGPNHTLLNLSHLPQGIYTMRITNQEGASTTRLSVVR
jgi:hypothetical protein